jgi:predicted P-loop ATPase
MGQRYFNGEENVYTRAVWKMWMIAAVARVFNSGCQADNAIILEGKQGLGKSTALRILTSKDDWFTDSTIDMTSKAGAEVLSGAWIVEIGELSSMKRVDVNTTKEFISRRFDKYRPAYARETVTIPRMCVFAGTVNPGYDGYLKDDTGNRRFWPVPCGASINLKLLEQERDQLWAEAVDLYNRGERWWVSNEENELLHHFEIKQRSRRERGQLEDKLTIWLIEKLQQNKNEEVEFTIAEALEKAFEIPVKEHSTKYWVKNLGETCSRMGIERSQIVRARYYYTTQDHNGAEQKKCTMSSQYIITYDQMHELTDGDIDLKLDLDRMNSIENNQLNETLEEEDDGIPF